MLGPLSPSSYQPECLSKIASVCEKENIWTGLLLQFHHFDSWILVPEYQEHCLSYMDLSDKKSYFIKFAKQRLMLGDTSSAISVLEKCKRDSWPEIYRQDKYL